MDKCLGTHGSVGYSWRPRRTHSVIEGESGPGNVHKGQRHSPVSTVDRRSDVQ